MEPVHPVSWVVGRRCPVPAPLAARVLDRLVRTPPVVALTGAVLDAAGVDPRSSPWTPTWRGGGPSAGSVGAGP